MTKDIFITEIPSFDEMADFREELKSTMKMLTNLAEGHDVAQRATDLFYQICELKTKAKELLVEEELCSNDETIPCNCDMH